MNGGLYAQIDETGITKEGEGDRPRGQSLPYRRSGDRDPQGDQTTVPEERCHPCGHELEQRKPRFKGLSSELNPGRVRAEVLAHSKKSE